MLMLSILPTLLLTALVPAPQAVSPRAASPRAAALPAPAPLAWDARHAEHLLNRAGFGADSRSVARAVERGLEATLEELFAVDPWLAEPFYARLRSNGNADAPPDTLTPDEKRERQARMRAEDTAQMNDFQDWWIARMLAGQEPLVERLTLFWHGHFTSSFRDVKSSYELIRQNQTFRRHALGSFAELLSDMARDPALLIYLDNDQNRKGKPNENFARELLELFTLGEGHYTEEDVREVARAFTGWGARQGEFRFLAKQHDRGRKTILGRRGNFDGRDVVSILLEQPACARHVAGRLIAYFEGVEPAAPRLERYASQLLEDDYRIDRFLGRLFRDPDFYRDEVLGIRIAGPIEYLVGSARRLGLEVPPRALGLAASLLGQRLFGPPSVQGWEGGVAWVAASPPDWSGGMMALLLGDVDEQQLVRDWAPSAFGSVPGAVAAMSDEDSVDEDSMMGAQEDTMASMEGPETEETPIPPVDDAPSAREKLRAARRRLPDELRRLTRMDLRPRLNLTRRYELARTVGDRALARALAEDLLAIPVAEARIEAATENLRRVREAAGLTEEAFLSRPEVSEPLLRAQAADLLALPEARFH